MFTTLIVRPIFNLLVAIYALVPGHNFGLAVIIFTVIIGLLMWPLVKKQLHQTRVMRQLAPELKKIKQAAKGNRQKEAQMVQELYKERGIDPFGTIGVMLLRVPIFIGLYSGLHRIVVDPHQLVSFSYPFLQHLPWMKQLAGNIHLLDHTLFGVVDLTRGALGSKGIYWPAMVIVASSAAMQYFQSKQLLGNDKSAKNLRTILREAGGGRQADQTEVNAAVGRSTQFLLPLMIFLVTVNIASAISLYWLVIGIVAFIQQGIALREDTTEMEAMADGRSSKTQAKAGKNSTKNPADIIEAEVIAPSPADKAKSAHKSKSKSSSTHKKRRKR